MRNILLSVCILFVLNTAFAAPQPAIVQSPDEWTLETKFEHPQRLVVTDKKGKEQVFWYVILTLTNNTSSDVDFYPKCELMTDTFQIQGNIMGVPPYIFNRIQLRHQKKYPFLENMDRVGNKILQGKDNTRDMAIIWPDFDKGAKAISIFVGGLSNETVVLDHPTENKKIFLRKTLQLDYTVGGESTMRSDLNLKFVAKKWVMR